MERITEFFKANPSYFGLVFVAMGVFFLLASIFNWKIVFGNVNPATYSLKKLDGIINTFGLKIARLVFGAGGLFIIATGLVWFLLA